MPSGVDPDRSIRQPLQSRRKLVSSTAMGMRSLCRLLPIGSQIRTLVRRTERQSRMGRDHLLTKPEHGIISGQTPSVALSGLADMHPAWSYPWHRLPCQRGPHRGKGRPSVLEGLPLPLVSSLLPSIIPALPWPIKGKAEHPTKEIDSTHHNRTTSIEP